MKNKTIFFIFYLNAFVVSAGGEFAFGGTFFNLISA